MLKKSSSILLAVISWLMLTATPVLADIPIDWFDDTTTPTPLPTPIVKYHAPATISLLNTLADWSLTEHREVIYPLGGKYFSKEDVEPSLYPTTSYPLFLLFFFPLYLIVFALNYAIEYSVGLFFKFSKQKHFPLIVLLINLATHPLLTLVILSGFSRIFINTDLSILFFELLIMLVEALIFGWWYNRNKPKKSAALSLARALGFSFTINLASFLIGEFISWTTPLITSSNPSLNYYVLCLIILVFIVTISWIFRRPRRKYASKASL